MFRLKESLPILALTNKVSQISMSRLNSTLKENVIMESLRLLSVNLFYNKWRTTSKTSRRQAVLKDYKRPLTRTMALSDLTKFLQWLGKAKPFVMHRERKLAQKKTNLIILKARDLPRCPWAIWTDKAEATTALLSTTAWPESLEFTMIRVKLKLLP